MTTGTSLQQNEDSSAKTGVFHRMWFIIIGLITTASIGTLLVVVRNGVDPDLWRVVANLGTLELSRSGTTQASKAQSPRVTPVQFQCGSAEINSYVKAGSALAFG